MARCVIIGAGELDADFLSDFSWREDDYIICADGGLYHAQQAGIRPDLLIGDQDSFVEGFPKGIPALTCRPEKDDSDMMLAVKEGISRGYEVLYCWARPAAALIIRWQIFKQLLMGWSKVSLL